MTLKRYDIIALTAIFLGSSGLMIANQAKADDDAPARLNLSDETDAPTAVPEPPGLDEVADIDLAESFEEFVGGGNYGAPNFLIEEAPYVPRVAARFGWWGVNTSGSKSGVGEWQGLDSSSPFWDIDGLSSNGYRTIDFFATGVENDTTQGGLYFYGGPAFSMDVEYDRFLHRLGHPPLGGVPDALGYPPPVGFFDPVLSDGPVPPEQPGYVMFGEDFTPGEDYAIRVQTLDAKFQGNLTENIKWRLNVWGMKKTGNRRANSQQHCYAASPAPSGSSNTCHVVSQGQRIDWLTKEIEPGVAVRLGKFTVDYSHTIRTFEQNDQMVVNDFSRGTPYGFGPGAEMGAYAFVPENITEIDRVKIGGNLGMDTNLYVLGNVGNTHNRFRDSDRKFYGADARITNRSIDGLSVTAYGKTQSQENDPDTVALNARYPDQTSLWLEDTPPQTIYNPDSLYLGLVDRDTRAAGVKGRWQPFHNYCDVRSGLSLTGGYEYKQLERRYVTYDLEALDPPVLFTQPTTVSNMFFVGANQDWSRKVNTYVRYRFIHNEVPLLGVTHRAAQSLDQAINSNLPEQVNRIEIGGNWTPYDNFMLSASFWIENTSNHSDYVNFDEDNYPVVVSAWYAPDERWSFSAGYASFSNWIDQDITLGREAGGQISRGSRELAAWTDTWSYKGRSDVVTLGTDYAVNCDLTLTGGFEYVRGNNYISNIPVNNYTIPALGPFPEEPRSVTYPEIQNVSEVEVQTMRLSAGLDYRLTNNLDYFGRYNYYDYDDIAMAWNRGQAHMFLMGLSGVY